MSIISAGCGQLVRMLVTLKPHGIFDFLYIFFKKNARENDKEKRKRKILAISGFVHLCARLSDYNKSVLDHSVIT